MAGAALGVATQGANAAAVNVNTWNEFGLDDPGSALVNGSGTTLATNPPDLNPIVQVGDAPWTITLTGPATLTVLDLFNSVDQFEIFDNAVSLGLTSVPTDGGSCGSDITCSLGNLRYSRGVFALGAGNHSLTGTHTLGIPGAAVFEITTTAVPEPASLTLLGAALAGFGLFRRRRNRA